MIQQQKIELMLMENIFLNARVEKNSSVYQLRLGENIAYLKVLFELFDRDYNRVLDRINQYYNTGDLHPELKESIKELIYNLKQHLFYKYNDKY